MPRGIFMTANTNGSTQSLRYSSRTFHSFLALTCGAIDSAHKQQFTPSTLRLVCVVCKHWTKGFYEDIEEEQTACTRWVSPQGIPGQLLFVAALLLSVETLAITKATGKSKQVDDLRVKETLNEMYSQLQQKELKFSESEGKFSIGTNREPVWKEALGGSVKGTTNASHRLRRRDTVLGFSKYGIPNVISVPEYVLRKEQNASYAMDKKALMEGEPEFSYVQEYDALAPRDSPAGTGAGAAATPRPPGALQAEESKLFAAMEDVPGGSLDDANPLLASGDGGGGDGDATGGAMATGAGASRDDDYSQLDAIMRERARKFQQRVDGAAAAAPLRPSTSSSSASALVALGAALLTLLS